MDLYRRIRIVRQQLGLSGLELARRAEVSPSYISLIEHGEKVPSEQVAVRLARALGESEDLYRAWAATARMGEETRRAIFALQAAGGAAALESQAGETPPKVPILAGHALPVGRDPDQGEIEKMLTLDSSVSNGLATERCVALRVDESNGSRVPSVFRAGDLVLVDRSDREVRPGLVYAVHWDERIQLSLVERSNGGISMLSDALSTDQRVDVPLQEHADLVKLIFGTVVWSCRKWT